MTCKSCNKLITKGDVFNHQSQTYEYAEMGHFPLCRYYHWDFRTLGDSVDHKDKPLKISKGYWKNDNIQGF